MPSRSFGNWFSNLFVGSTQSYLAALAITLVIILVSLAVFLSKKAGGAGSKIGIVALFILISLPGILLTLFDITCLVTAGPGCDIWAWIKTLVILLYSILIIVALVTLLAKHADILNNRESFSDAAGAPSAPAAALAAIVAPSAEELKEKKEGFEALKNIKDLKEHKKPAHPSLAASMGPAPSVPSGTTSTFMDYAPLV